VILSHCRNTRSVSPAARGV